MGKKKKSRRIILADPNQPAWWKGKQWPKGGINSLADLERWIDKQQNEMFWHRNSDSAAIQEIGRDFGRQAIINATRYLSRHGDVSPPHSQKRSSCRTWIVSRLHWTTSSGTFGRRKPNRMQRTSKLTSSSRRGRQVKVAAKRSWTQHDLDNAIREYKAKRAAVTMP